jgi:hypothetical protein
MGCLFRMGLQVPDGLKKDFGKVIYCRCWLGLLFSKQEQFKFALRVF